MIISDIAKLASVSVAAASRVLNSKGCVEGETRQKVEDPIQENGYRPNAVARSLTRSNTSMIAVIMSDRLNPSFANVLDVIESRAERQGYNILLYNTLRDRGRECKATTQATRHRVTGILLLPVLDPGEQTEELLAGAEDSGTPVVLIDGDLYNSDLDIVLIDNKKIVYEGAKFLIESSYRKIGIVACPEVVGKGKTRLDGYVQCLEDHGTETEDEHIYPGDSGEKSGYQACENPLRLLDPPTAVLVTCSSATLGCIRYLNGYNLQIGRDIRSVESGDTSPLGILGCGVAMVDKPMKEMGGIAYNPLTERMVSPDIKRRRGETLLQTRLIIRGSEKPQDMQTVSQEEYL